MCSICVGVNFPPYVSNFFVQTVLDRAADTTRISCRCLSHSWRSGTSWVSDRNVSFVLKCLLKFICQNWGEIPWERGTLSSKDNISGILVFYTGNYSWSKVRNYSVLSYVSVLIPLPPDCCPLPLRSATNLHIPCSKTNTWLMRVHFSDALTRDKTQLPQTSSWRRLL